MGEYSVLNDLTGQKFGYWTVLGRAPSKKGNTMWLCRCECGTERAVYRSSLLSGASVRCGCSDTMIPGTKTGRLTTIGLDHKDKYGHSYCKFLCECGRITIQAAANVAIGEVVSCGCYRDEVLVRLHEAQRFPEGVAAFNSLYSVYRSAGKSREYEFSLSKEEFFLLTKGCCEYCGVVPHRVWKGSSRCMSPYVYNGVDRIDNSLGYTTNNVVSCCLTCNRAKNNLSLEEFQKWIKRLITFQNSKSDAASVGKE